MPARQDASMDSVRVSRAVLAFAFAAVLVAGALVGSVVTAISSGEQPSPTITRMPTVSPADARLPDADVDGEDFARLPRYPGSVRTEFSISQDDRYRLTAVEYFADADLDAVRTFYQDVIDEQGWQRADITYTGGEWTYLLVDGASEALIEIEISGGFVEVDLQVSAPLPSTPPAPTPRVTPAPPVPPAPPPPPPADDDGDDDDDDEGAGDDSGDDGDD